jgi:antitoxin PrlF
VNGVAGKGQVTILKPIRDALDIHPGSHVAFTINRDGDIVLRKAGIEAPAPHPFDRMIGILGPEMTTDEVMALARGED